MIRSISVTNHFGEKLTMELGNPEKSGFFISRIDGLGPAKAEINTSNITSIDGALFNSARVTPRNITMVLGFMHEPTIEHVRQKSYKFFPIKKRIKVEIKTDRRQSMTYGYVESNEPLIFSQLSGTNISILCPDPYLYSTGPNGKTVTTFVGVEKNFEFPFYHEGEIPTLEMGKIISVPEQTIYYNGDADTGLYIRIRAVGPVKNITLHNIWTRELMKIDTDKLEVLTGAGLDVGDVIEISTIRGNKSAMLFRAGSYINIINCLDRKTDWFQITKGDNVFAYTVEEGEGNIELRMENNTLYEGA